MNSGNHTQVIHKAFITSTFTHGGILQPPRWVCGVLEWVRQREGENEVPRVHPYSGLQGSSETSEAEAEGAGHFI